MVTMSVFVKPLIPVWQCERNLFEILGGTISKPVHDLKVKVTNFYIKVLCYFFLQFQFFAKPSMDLNHVWHDIGLRLKFYAVPSQYSDHRV